MGEKNSRIRAASVERLCAYLRHRAPIAQIGHSIFVFDLTDDDLRRALYGPPAELEKDACVTGL